LKTELRKSLIIAPNRYDIGFTSLARYNTRVYKKQHLPVNTRVVQL